MPTSADIRRFLTDAFSDEEIATICFDQFRSVYENFGTGMTKGQKIQLLIEYCERHDAWTTLLPLLQRDRPQRFAQFIDSSAATDSPAQVATPKISGGINLNANDVSIGGDAVGQDKIITINGNVYIVHVGEVTDPLSVMRSTDESRPNTPSHVHLENPFYTAGRINDPQLFFGREQLVRELRQELGKRTNVSLVGETQMGKSSLLYYLYATRTEWLPGETIEYLDLQRVFDEADFCEMVLQQLGSQGNTLRNLRYTLATRRVILLLDEVERLASPDFSPRLHDLLRSLAQEQHFAMCLATRKPLEAVFPAETPGGVSPFHNIFTRKIIGPFTNEEAIQFLKAYLFHSAIRFSTLEIEHLLIVSKCHPARLQYAAQELFNEKSRSLNKRS